ncbi:MAG: hypothetical protein E6K17_03380 [Methanobacteriota archaeon]|nr:MAG: hypothetical protein E6K17_03380 [Euryarchaeota archaeon]
MAVPGLFWIELGLGVVLLFLSAKAHGRQIRLERELEGYMEVDFMKDNPPWVEALWRKDRRRYWATVPIATVVLLLLGFLTLPPRFGTEPLGNPNLGTVLLAGFLWPLVVAFTSNGIQSALRLQMALKRETPNGQRRATLHKERGPWLRSAFRGTVGYWGLVAGLAAMAALFVLG